MSELSELPNWSGQVLEGEAEVSDQRSTNPTPPPDSDEGGRRGPSGLVLGLILGLLAGLLLAGVGIGSFWLGSRQNDDVATDGSATATPEIVDDDATSEEASSEGSTAEGEDADADGEDTGVAPADAEEDGAADAADAEDATDNATEEFDPATGARILPADGIVAPPAGYQPTDPNYEARIQNAPDYAVVRGGKVFLYGFAPDAESLAESKFIVEGVMGPDGYVIERFIDPDTPETDGAPIYVDDKVLFAFNSVELDPGSLPTLDLGVMLMLLNPTAQMEIIARSDAVGSEEANLEVSENRGQAVVDYWASQGVDPSRMTVNARGEADASESDDAETAALNRSVEFVVSGIELNL